MAIKMKRLLVDATAWMNLANIINKAKKQKNKHKRSHIVRFHLYKMFKMSKTTDTGSRIVIVED